MANTYFARGIPTNAINKTLMTLYNASGSTSVVRVYRIWMTPMSTSSVSGGIGTLIFDKITGTPASGTSITCTKLDTTNTTVPADVTARYGAGTAITGTFTSLGELFRLSYSNDEPAAAVQTADELRTLWPLSLINDFGYGDSEVEPLVLRAAEGLRLYTLNAGTFGSTTIEIVIQFTIT